MGADAKPIVLVVDDEPSLREVLDITLRRAGLDVLCAPGARSAIEHIDGAGAPFPLVLTDLVMPDGSGIDVLAAARARSDDTQVIVITAHSTVDNAIDAMRQGAYDFVTKPFSPSEIAALAHKALEKSAILTENRRLKERVASMTSTPDEVFGEGEPMRRVAALVRKAATTRTTVLITGESGTGKERIARSLHRMSDRADGPFCVINCGALPESLMESELFGHERGAFTGAATAAHGLFRQAHGGTLLLDEIGELPPPLQVKLLRVLQERKVRPVGSPVEIDVDVRVLAATNRDVEAAVETGEFRKDLYYRLNVIRVELPPLRERPGDVRRLAEQMVQRFAAEMDKQVRGITPAALRALDGYGFPGNIRELENMMERAVALASAEWIEPDDLPESVVRHAGAEAAARYALPAGGCDLDGVLADFERSVLLQALERTGGVRKAAAGLLGITFRSMRYRLSKLGLDDDRATSGEPPDSG